MHREKAGDVDTEGPWHNRKSPQLGCERGRGHNTAASVRFGWQLPKTVGEQNVEATGARLSRRDADGGSSTSNIKRSLPAAKAIVG